MLTIVEIVEMLTFNHHLLTFVGLSTFDVPFVRRRIGSWSVCRFFRFLHRTAKQSDGEPVENYSWLLGTGYWFSGRRITLKSFLSL